MKKIKILYKYKLLDIEYYFRWWKNKTIVYIHWLWCSKTDYDESLHNNLFNDFNILTFDLVWHWNTSYLKNIEIDDLVEITKILLTKLKITKINLIWHSLWWVIWLLFVKKYSTYVESFINIEWNLSYDDCFFSRKATEVDYNTFEKRCFNIFKEWLIDTNKNWFWRYVHTLEKHKPLKAFYELSPSLVNYSENWLLLETFVNLKIPKLFIYWDENSHLKYLSELEEKWCPTIWISNSNHFPQFDNPDEFYNTIYSFLKKV